MIGTWMMAATGFALFLGIAAAGVERVLRAARRPTRAVWVVALGAAFAWPPLAWIFLTQRSAAAGLVRVGAPVPVGTPVGDASMLARLLGHLDTTLLVLWVAASLVMLVQTARAIRVLRRVRRCAKVRAMDGDSVLVSESLGPAVLGLRDMRIVIPSWLLDLDAPLRAPSARA